MSINFRVGDLFALDQYLCWDDGSAIDLSGADSVYIIITKYGDESPLIENPCTVINATDGHIQYVFEDGDTDAAGMYTFYFQIRYPAIGEEEYRGLSIPSRGKHWLHIEE